MFFYCHLNIYETTASLPPSFAMAKLTSLPEGAILRTAFE